MCFTFYMKHSNKIIFESNIQIINILQLIILNQL
jgi:hypothetical protein